MEKPQHLDLCYKNRISKHLPTTLNVYHLIAHIMCQSAAAQGIYVDEVSPYEK